MKHVFTLLRATQAWRFKLYGTRVVGDRQGEIIIGRNVINQLVVTLNGLAEVVEVSN